MYNNLYTLADKLNITIDFTQDLVLKTMEVEGRTIYIDKFESLQGKPYIQYFSYKTRLNLAAGIAHILLKRGDSVFNETPLDYEAALLVHNMFLHTNQVALYKLNRDSWVKPENVAKTFEISQALVEMKMDLVGYEY